ncbi:hypothetical protein F4823DRAFT_636551 [Ustulina deusta]|nr:hypothetical protein F4823DRAFT_636551 [Ustulina deusta]
MENFDFGRACMVITTRLSEKHNAETSWKLILPRALFLEVDKAEELYRFLVKSDPVPWVGNNAASFGIGEEMEISLMKAALEVSSKDTKTALAILASNSIGEEAARLLEPNGENKTSTENSNAVVPAAPKVPSRPNPTPKPASKINPVPLSKTAEEHVREQKKPEGDLPKTRGPNTASRAHPAPSSAASRSLFGINQRNTPSDFSDEREDKRYGRERSRSPDDNPPATYRDRDRGRGRGYETTRPGSRRDKRDYFRESPPRAYGGTQNHSSDNSSNLDNLERSESPSPHYGGS